jgi:HEPN domain-containing protein
MPPEPGSPADWLRFARSDLAVAQGPVKQGVLLETLCFHAQQAAEKSLKAILLSQGISFPLTHNLKVLLGLLPATLVPPLDADVLARLTEYAASARYPGEYEEVTQDEYREAIRLAEAVVTWAEDLLARDERR